MKLLIYSDLHLEFGNDFKPPKDVDADVMILAGDITTFNERGFAALKEFLKGSFYGDLVIAGNHEYYADKDMRDQRSKFIEYAYENLSYKFRFLEDEGINILTSSRVAFFGGTMWTDFNKSNAEAMNWAQNHMNDFYKIQTHENLKLRPEDTVKFHVEYKEKLIAWLEENQGKKRVVISHHAPVINPKSAFKNSKLQPAFNSLDMIEIIEKYQPELWVYGHTHESDDQMIGKTRIVSNPFGYFEQQENQGFKPGFIVEV